MDGPMVSASMGVMVSLQSKLNTSKDQARFKDVKGDVVSLKDELVDMKALMRKFATGDDTDLQVKEWLKQVREVGYDTEDYIDRQAPAASERGLLGGLFDRKLRKKLAEQIKELKARVKEASDRRSRYMLGAAPGASVDDADDDLGPSNVTVDPKLLYGVHGGLVGMGAPTNDLVGHLATAGEKQFKVISIVGVGGLGKTTLAKEVYRTIHGQFQYCAFVDVGRCPHVRAVLLDMLRQLNPHEHPHDDMDDQSVIVSLREFLKEKRYFIAIDDIWSISAWKAIKCSLPENAFGSRIVATTRMNEVAKSCSSRPSDIIHLMKHLSESDSKKLFLSRLLSGSKGVKRLAGEAFEHIWKICGGMPLALIVMAGLFNKKSSCCTSDDVSIHEREAVMGALEQYPCLQGMRRILRISYSDLCLPVKTCLLYLSIFPEDIVMEKERLIRRWIAEGFIPKRDKESLWVTAESYLNDLVNRRLIRPEPEPKTRGQQSYTVHDVILEFIASICAEENFVTSESALQSMPSDVIRRLSINCCNLHEDGVSLVNLQEEGAFNLSQVRSLTVFGLAESMMPSLAEMQLLRVLDVKDAKGLRDGYLQGIEKLFHLRYLGLGGGPAITKLPDKLKELQHVETLDVRETAITELPEPIARRWKQLVCLLAASLLLPTDGMDSMDSMEELSMVRVSDKESLARLAKLAVRLKQLRALGVSWCFGDKDDKHLASSLEAIGGSSCIESLLLDAGNDATPGSLDLLVESWVLPYKVQKFAMTTSSGRYFPKVPPKMTLHESLAHLEMDISQLRSQDLDVLRSLTALVFLKLRAMSSKDPLRITDKGFQCLQVFWFESNDGGLGFAFGKGAMAELRKLQLCFQAGEEEKLHGVGYLSSLEQVHATVRCSDDSHFKATAEAIAQIVSMNNKKPTVELTKA